MKKNIIIVKLQRLRDSVRRQLGLLLFDRKKNGNFDLTKTQSILFIRNDAKIGDAIVSSGLINKIRKYKPNIKIIVMTTPSMTELFKNGFGVDDVIHLKKRPSYSEIKLTCKKLGSIDVAVSLNSDMKMKDIYLHRCLQTKVNIGLDSRVKLVNKDISSETSKLHYAFKFDYIAQSIGINTEPERYIVPIKEASLKKVEHFLQNLGISHYILFNPFGSGGSRKLNKTNIQKIIHTKESSCPVILLSSPSTKDELNKMDICDNLNVFHFDQSDSIYDAIAIVKRADSVISVDTSIVHIASGLGKKQIAIYTNDRHNYQDWGPNSNLATSVFTTKDINEIDVNQFYLM